MKRSCREEVETLLESPYLHGVQCQAVWNIKILLLAIKYKGEGEERRSYDISKF